MLTSQLIIWNLDDKGKALRTLFKTALASPCTHSVRMIKSDNARDMLGRAAIEDEDKSTKRHLVCPVSRDGNESSAVSPICLLFGRFCLRPSQSEPFDGPNNPNILWSTQAVPR